MRGPKGANPSSFRERTPGWSLIRVSVGAGDSRQVLERIRKEPGGERVRYLGAMRGFHVLEKPPAGDVP